MKIVKSAVLVLTMFSASQAAAAASPIQTRTGTLGPASAGMGQVVFFRTSGMGPLLGCTVREGAAEMARLGVGKYYAVPVAPGIHEYNTKGLESRDKLRIEVEAGETYFVKCSIAMGFMAGNAKVSASDEAEFTKSAAGLKAWEPKAADASASAQTK